MISSNAFDYINVLGKAADASWIRNDLIANNIANYDTPGYKRQDVDFEDALKQAIQSAGGTNMDTKVANLRKGSLDVSPYTDYGDYSYRLDENNVDVETEQVQLAENQIRYQALMDSINNEFSNLKSAMK
ncbi:MAG: flagellar basal body rod protein FlgB [Lachnospiraceae bacterium]|nr:flagellar basal body rod protein FlgB [Lachnospiraceae bacterium]